MNKKTRLFCIAVGCMSIITGCQKTIHQDELSETNTEARSLTSENKISLSNVDFADPISLADREKAEQRKNQLKSFLGSDFSLNSSYLINPEDYTCSTTSFTTWLRSTINFPEARDEINRFSFFYTLDIPTLYKLIIDNNASDEYFGRNGEYNQIARKRFKDLNQFWDINRQIMLLGMHSNLVIDSNVAKETYPVIFGIPRNEVMDQISMLFFNQTYPYSNTARWQYGNHPLFSLNAFAFNGQEIEGIGYIPTKIVMGDGIVEAFAAMGFGDVAFSAILAHEYAHQVQYERNAFESDLVGAEATRRTELMADAMAAYFLSHARGASMQWKRVQQFLQVYFNIGDCAFDNNGHHGTPNQRMRAAQWGYSVANNAQKQGHILSSTAFIAMFEQKFPELIAPDRM